jgi:hypothetical protein
MKKLYYYLFLISFNLFAISCEDLFNPDENPNELNGNVDIPYSKVDNTFWSSISIDGKYIDVGDSCYISKNDNGIVTLKIQANIKDFPQLKDLVSLIPDDVIDSEGYIRKEFKMKITDEGIQDYFNKDGKPHTIVKYDCKVGDKYILKKSDGTTITREVIGKSTEDDFPYGFYYIKTITIAQDSRIPGVRKITYKANHKFGLVYFAVEMEDDTIIKSWVFSKENIK